MIELIMIRYGEMTLKKKNYRQFLKTINNTIAKALARYEKVTFIRQPYRGYIYLNGTEHEEIVQELLTIPGIHSLCLCEKSGESFAEIARIGARMLQEAGGRTFKVETHRANKNYPATSPEITQAVAARILPQLSGYKVDVHHPEVVLHIDVRGEGVFLYTQEEPGLGGLPAGSGGSGLLMMSGGIDSPVAGFLALKKGLTLTAMHFASPPHTSPGSLQKVVDLLENLARFSGNKTLKLVVVPFTAVQERILARANRAYLVTLMRRGMFKIADRYLRESGIGCIVTGESIGQVASQTIESMSVVNDVTNSLILRPLITYDKTEIADLSKALGTYEISIRPYEDCCTVFVPEHPIIKPQLDFVLAEEAKCDYEMLLTAALQAAKQYTIRSDRHLDIVLAEEKGWKELI